MTIRCATGKDFDRMNDMSAHSRLQDLVELASGTLNLSPKATAQGIEARAHFIMQVW